jgi:hypothetical protein
MDTRGAVRRKTNLAPPLHDEPELDFSGEIKYKIVSKRQLNVYFLSNFLVDRQK